MKRFLLLAALFASSSSTSLFSMQWIEHLNNYQGYKCSGQNDNKYAGVDKYASVSSFRLKEVFSEIEFRCKELTFNYKRDNLCKLTANKFNFRKMIESLNLDDRLLENNLIMLRDLIFVEEQYSDLREILKLNAEFYRQAAEIIG